MTTAARRDVFQAIADPTRREILGIIARESMNVSTLCEHFSISRPAISQQLRILEECGLLEIIQSGRERYCHARLKPLSEVQEWVSRQQRFWGDKLDDLEHFLNQSKD